MFAKTILVLLCGTSASSCGWKPGSFWEEFRPELLVHTEHGVEAHQGHTAIRWSAEKAGTLDRDAIVTFAEEYGWTLVDERQVARAELVGWTYMGKKFFPLGWTGLAQFDDSHIYRCFARTIETDAVLLSFESDMLLVNPETHEETFRNGYALLAKDGRELAVYRLWGDPLAPW